MASRIDIRVLKKQQRQLKSKAAVAAAQAKDLKSALAAENKSIVHHLLEKLQNVGDETASADDDVGADEGQKPERQPEVKEEAENNDDDQDEDGTTAEVDDKVVKDETDVDQKESSQCPVGVNDNDTADEGVSDDDNMEGAPETNRVPPKDELVHNPWSKRVKVNNDFNDDKPFVSDDFKVAFEERKRKQKEGGLLNGWEECDIVDCFCKEEPLGQGALQILRPLTVRPKLS